MILNENLGSTTIDCPITSIEPKNSSFDFNHSVDKNNSSNNFNTDLSNTNNNTESVKILKNFYKKDAAASVTKSFLKIDVNDLSSNKNVIFENFNEIEKQSKNFFKLIQEEETTNPSCLTNSTNKNSLNCKQQSCITFLNNLLDNEKIKKLNTDSNPTNVQEYKEKKVNSNNSIKRGLKLVSRVLSSTNNRSNTNTSPSTSLASKSSSSSPFASNSNLSSVPVKNQTKKPSIKMIRSNHSTARMNEYSNPNYLLLSKKLRKQLPFNSGIKNHGNTCFLNSVLQSLFHTSPLCDYFVTEHYENDIRLINYQRQYQNLNSSVNSFALTRHFNRLLNSLWHNSYDSNYSAEIKELIGRLNPTFAGSNQNDAHEFCVWVLDRLSQELTYNNPLAKNLNENEENDLDSAKNLNKLDTSDVEGSKNQKPNTSSFIEELFKVKFKSTVICSVCNFKSIKYETDMMLSLPLPQSSVNSKTSEYISESPKLPIRRSLYANLILNNPQSIKFVTASYQQNNASYSYTPFSQSNSRASDSLDSNSNDYNSQSKSKFYLQENNVLIHTNGVNEFLAPYHVKIGVNVHISNDKSYTRDLVNLNNSINSTSTVVNPNFSDLKTYFKNTYNLDQSDLVFLNLNHTLCKLSDMKSVKQILFQDKNNVDNNNTEIEENNPKIEDSMCVIEIPLKTQQPLINIVALNVYFLQQKQIQTNYVLNNSNKQFVTYGLPFTFVINRDCSYSELCKQLLESQSKNLKDKNVLKYKDLVEKFFNLSLIDVNETQCETKPIDSSNEYPLCTEFVDKSLNITQNQSNNSNEYIRLNIEWRSYEDISSFFKEFDYTKAEYVHRSVKYLQKHDELDSQNKKISNENLSYNENLNSVLKPMETTTLNECFELFTQSEELTEENSWKCPKCSRKVANAFKKLCISSVPPILIIHLKRFFYKSKTSNFKLTTPVWFPVSNLDMSKYLEGNQNVLSNSDKKDLNENDIMKNRGYFSTNGNESEYDYSQETNASRSYVYDLFAVCNHKGQNMANGHYTAYCKSLIDTQWYAYDDANCFPIIDNSISSNNFQNIYNDGSSGVCTENAYILFYKQRGCMRNEKWWKPYIDRVLYDYDEFHTFLANLDLIEKHQQRNQTNEQNKQFNQQPTHVQIISKENYGTHLNSMKKISSGVKTLRKFLGNSNSNSRIEETMRFESSNESVPSNDAQSKDLNYQSEHTKQNDLLNHRTDMKNSNSDVLLLNCYDEIIRPKRLAKQSNPSNSSNSSNAVGSNSSISSSSPLSKQSVSELSLKHLILNNDQQNSNFLDFPSDNDYTNFNEGNFYHTDICFNNKETRFIPELDNGQAKNPEKSSFKSIVPVKSFKSNLNGQIRSSNHSGEKTKNRYGNSTSIETNI